jgi:hypothetical protein
MFCGRTPTVTAEYSFNLGSRGKEERWRANMVKERETVNLALKETETKGMSY